MDARRASPSSAVIGAGRMSRPMKSPFFDSPLVVLQERSTERRFYRLPGASRKDGRGPVMHELDA
jgi:hypothetical protein